MRHFGGVGGAVPTFFGAFPAGENISLLLLMIFWAIPPLRLSNVILPPISGAGKGLPQKYPDFMEGLSQLSFLQQ